MNPLNVPISSDMRLWHCPYPRERFPFIFILPWKWDSYISFLAPIVDIVLFKRSAIFLSSSHRAPFGRVLYARAIQFCAQCH